MMVQEQIDLLVYAERATVISDDCIFAEDVDLLMLAEAIAELDDRVIDEFIKAIRG